ncbi:hypothetical protein VTO42DRAFT_6350 [Malbranchea cinnamomea]
MAATRQNPPAFKVYQDPIDLARGENKNNNNNANAPTTVQPNGQSPALQPLYNATANRDFVLNPPSAAPAAHASSPVKPQNISTSSAPAGTAPETGLSYVPLSAPEPVEFATDSPPKRPQHNYPPPPPLPPAVTTAPQFQPQYFYLPSGQPSYDFTVMQQQPLFTTFSSVPGPQQQPNLNNAYVGRTRNNNNNNKENRPPHPPPASASYTGAPVTGKRSVAAAPPAKERPAKKAKRDPEPENIPIPDPENMPPIMDDGTKPPYSYAVLIGMAILRSPNRRLTLAQIYKWISDNFSFYRAGDSGWQNSIRHNLSLNKAFIKKERPKDDPGKGNYWAIQPGMEAQFMKDRPVRRPAPMATMPLPQPAPPRVEQPKVQVKTEQQDAPVTATGSSTHNSPLPSQNTKDNQDLSSDATWTASDPALHEDSGDETAQPISHQSAEALHSSPPQVIKSSPPVVLAPPPPPPPTFVRAATPPTPSRPSGNATASTRSRKRNADAMNDSGYYSSLESSAMKKARRVSTSETELDPPRLRSGRAEEEIARMLSSSHDISPMRPRGQRDNPYLVPSSPVRPEYVNTAAVAQPVTPAIKVEEPPKPPASLSPNTQLQNHRQKIRKLVSSPIKKFGLEDSTQYPVSPAFRLPDEPETVLPDDSNPEDGPRPHPDDEPFVSFYPNFSAAALEAMEARGMEPKLHPQTIAFLRNQNKIRHRNMARRSCYNWFDPGNANVDENDPINEPLFDSNFDNFVNYTDTTVIDPSVLCSPSEPRSKPVSAMRYVTLDSPCKNNSKYLVDGGTQDMKFDKSDDSSIEDLEKIDLAQGFNKRIAESSHSPKELLVNKGFRLLPEGARF